MGQKLLVFTTIIVLMVGNFFYQDLRAGSETIVIAADTWCPINCAPESELPGYMIEIAEKVYKKQGIKIEYKVIPWARAIVEAKKGNVQAIVGAFKGDAPKFIFPEEELGLIGNSYFTHQQSDWDFYDISSLENIVLGVIKDYDYGELVNHYIHDPNNTHRVSVITGYDNVLARAMNMLMAKRIDVIVESDVVFWHQAKKVGLENHFRNAGRAAEPAKAYIAFSPTNEKSERYAEILSAGVEKLRVSGELKAILERYGLQDWK